ncbi:MAG: hypothetical protein Greene041662_308 [Candidatus Peregrinibacteria bacterium Greene0416_62]|nr:MAG: hypothetical protein Greene041662_308 [Candidatus Peregrinibacteria bacterium Greene0416_62]TSC98764.1 MAG: hypothetical protein Greene101449_833 [Candidatus Peregrinibacteria bacterium Greene1014_49]
MLQLVGPICVIAIGIYAEVQFLNRTDAKKSVRVILLTVCISCIFGGVAWAILTNL